jgi:hypothetical protein
MRSTRTALALGSLILALCTGASGLPAEAGATTPATTPAGTSASSEAPPAGTSASSEAPAKGTGAPEQPPTAPLPAPTSTQLSNELTFTSWAHPESTGPIRLHPTAASPRIAEVHLYTADGFPEVYPILSSRLDAEGQEWDRVRVPGRPNGRTGWVMRELLGAVQRTRWRIAVDRGERRMRVYYGGRLLKVFPVGVGKPSTPTPAGHFWIDERFKLSNPSNPYWPYALGTSDYSTLPNWPGEGVIGIHGPFGEPQKIPGDPSHGCIRMLSPDIAWLGPKVTLGTPVDIG